jgi:hypothetical protein
MRGFRDIRRAASSIGKPMSWIGALSGVVLLAVPSASRADSVMLWNNTLLTEIQRTSGFFTNGPPEIAREIAMVDGAMYDAVNAATGEQYKPYAYAGGPVANASADAAALQAGYAVMESIFTSSQWEGAVPPVVLTDITTAYNTALSALGNSAPVTAGLNVGAAAATAMINLRSTDGSAAAIANGLLTYTPPGEGNAGVYVPPATRPAMFPTWGTVTPFTLTSSTQFPVPPPPPLNSSQYAGSLLETECLGPAGGPSSLPSSVQAACAIASGGNNFGLPATAGIDQSTGTTATNSTLALFWNDPGGTTVTPPGAWLQIADTVLTDQGVTSELQQARVTAMVGMADADSAIEVWQAKYAYTLWRPVTAISDITSANPSGTTCALGAAWNANFTTCDPGWTSLIATPPHPDYLAGHPAFSFAAATVLDAFFGTDDIPFCATSDQYVNSGTTIKPITLCYDSFMAAAQDATDSRIYGGIHTSYAVNGGIIVGEDVGAYLVAHDFTIPEPGSFGLLAVALVGLRTVRLRRRPAVG